MATTMIKTRTKTHKFLLTRSSPIWAYQTSIYLRGFLGFPPTTHLLEEQNLTATLVQLHSRLGVKLPDYS
jgi:hypothetical protein